MAFDSFNRIYWSFWSCFYVISATLKPCLGVLPVFLILGLQEYSWKSYTTSAGALPQKWYNTSGSTPKQTKIVQWSWHDIIIFIYCSHWTHCSALHWEPSQYFYFRFLGVIPIGLCYNMHNKYSHWPKNSLLGVLPETKNKFTERAPRVSSGINKSRIHKVSIDYDFAANVNVFASNL